MPRVVLIDYNIAWITSPKSGSPPVNPADIGRDVDRWEHFGGWVPNEWAEWNEQDTKTGINRLKMAWVSSRFCGRERPQSDLVVNAYAGARLSPELQRKCPQSRARSSGAPARAFGQEKRESSSQPTDSEEGHDGDTSDSVQTTLPDGLGSAVTGNPVEPVFESSLAAENTKTAKPVSAPWLDMSDHERIQALEDESASLRNELALSNIAITSMQAQLTAFSTTQRKS
ncbi:unnamed protein product [Discula destructiva]